MLDFRTNFLNHLMSLKKTQFTTALSTATPATIMALTNTFQTEMKALIEEKKIPAKYQLHFANLELVDQFITQGAHTIPADHSKLNEKAKASVNAYLAAKEVLTADFNAAITGFDDNTFQSIAVAFNVKVKRYLELHKAALKAINDDKGPGETPPQPMLNFVSNNNAAIAKARENARLEEEAKKKRNEQAEQQRLINAQVEEAKQQRLDAQKKEAQEKAKKEAEENLKRQQAQQEQAQNTAKAKAKAEFEAKRQQVLTMHQNQMGMLPALGLSRKVVDTKDLERLAAKKMVDEELAAIEARRVYGSPIQQECDYFFETDVKAKFPLSPAEVDALKAEIQERVAANFEYQRQQQARYVEQQRQQQEELAQERNCNRRYNYA